MALEGRERERRIGNAAVRAAARLCEAVRAEMIGSGRIDTLDKQDRSPVTVADFGAQAIICHFLSRTFPDDPIVAEEDSTALRAGGNTSLLATVTHFVGQQIGAVDEALVCRLIDLGAGPPKGRYWVLDPIDGTKGFLRNDQYAIALALIEDGEVQWGFLACPALPYAGSAGSLFIAGRGAGTEACSLNGTSRGAVRVSTERDPANARLAESVVSAHTNRDLAAQLKEVLGIRTEPLHMDSQAKYAAVAGGQATIYLRSPNPRTPDYRENVWDHAAGWLVVEEAGGRVTDVYGRPLDWTQGRRLEKNIGIVATNGRLHDAVITALAEILPARA